jgi:hypothetical protein
MLWGSWNHSVSIVSSLWGKRTGNQGSIPGKGGDVSLLSTVQIYFVTQKTSTSGHLGFFPYAKMVGMKLI